MTVRYEVLERCHGAPPYWVWRSTHRTRAAALKAARKVLTEGVRVRLRTVTTEEVTP